MSQFNKEVINVGVIGCGFGRIHINTLSKGVGSLCLKSVCDADMNRLEGIRTNPDVQGKDILFTTDYKQIFNDPEIDVVSLALPHHLHERFAVEAAEAGKHIMIDKPIARTLEEADRIIDACEKAGVQLVVAFNFRYSPFYRKLRDILNSGAVGKVLLGVTRHYQRFYYPGGSNWRKSASVGGGAVMGSGVHNLDMLRFCMGEPEEVFAYGVGDAKRLDAEAAATIVFKYADGAIVNFLCNWCKSSGHKVADPATVFGEWEFFCENGELRRHLDGKFRLARLDQEPEEVEFGSENAFEVLWRHFEHCLRTGELALTNGRDARKSLALVLKVYESINTGKPVKI